MNLNKMLFAALMTSAFSLSNCGQKSAVLQGEIYTPAQISGTAFTIDTAKSVLRWTGSKVTMKHNGIVKIKSGQITAKGDSITSGKIVFDMPTLVNVDLEGEMKGKMEGHLKSADFFDVSKFPEAAFEIASVTKSEKGMEIRGNLTIKGITKGISFPAEITFVSGKPTSATGTVVINRQNWGIVYPGMADDLIANDVQLDLNLTTVN